MEKSQIILIIEIKSAGPEVGSGDRTPLKSQIIGFLSNNGPDSPKNHKAVKPAFNVGPSLARQRWRFTGGADGGPLLLSYGSSVLLSSTKRRQSLTPL